MQPVINNEFSVPLSALWHDIKDPQFLWQVLALAAALGLAYFLARMAKKRVDRLFQSTTTSLVGRRTLRGLIFPCVAILVVYVVKAVLSKQGDVVLLSIALALLMAWAAVRIAFTILRQTLPNNIWLVYTEKIFLVLVWSAVALHLTGLLLPVINGLRDIEFTVGSQNLNLWIILKGLAWVCVTFILALWISDTMESKILAAERINGNLRLVLVRLIKVGLLILAVIISMSMVGIDLTALSVFGGALGVGLGFGLQKIAANYVSGFILLLDHSLRIDDLITVSGERGQVTQITTRYTILRTQTGVEIIVPNEQLVSSIVRNESYSDRNVRFTMQIQVAYETDLDQALAIIENAANSHPRVLPDPKSIAYVVEFADSGITLELGTWVSDPEKGFQVVRSEIYLAIWRAFREHRIQIPFPQREVRLLEGTPEPASSS